MIAVIFMMLPSKCTDRVSTCSTRMGSLSFRRQAGRAAAKFMTRSVARSVGMARATARKLRNAVVVGLLVSSGAWAVNTQFWSSATFEDFERGDLNGVSLSREGRMTLAPKLEELFSTDQAMIWAVAQDKQGNVYLGTGHNGKVFRMGPELEGSLFYDAPESDIFAMAVDNDGRLYVGTSPDGKVYQVDASGEGREFFDPESKYIWSLVFAADGALYVGTGDRGKIYRVPASGEGELYYDTQQSHIMSLAVTPDNELIVGTEPNGLLYRVSGPGKAFVLYDAPIAEIHSVAVSPDGDIFASAMGRPGRGGLRQLGFPAQGGQTPVRTSTTITVRAADEPGLPPGGAEEGPGQPGDPSRPGNQLPGQTSVRTAGGLPRVQNRRTATRSALYRVLPGGGVDTLWSSRRENIFDLLPAGEKLLFSTDQKGRIYELTLDRQLSLLAQTDQEQTTRLFPYKDFILATTANLGKVFRLGTKPAATGSYESEVRDAGSIASWGRISWSAELPPGSSLELLTRSGNSSRPDSTWSGWSEPYRQEEGEQISSPSARYMQWKAVFRAAAESAPVLSEVILAYLPQNRAPVLTEVKVTPRGSSAPSRTTSGNLAAARSIQNLTSGRAASSPSTSSRRASGQQGLNMTWLANDPDRDELAYELYFRGEGETAWKPLAKDLKQNYFQLQKDALPDGKYRLKVKASDAGVNPQRLAKTAERISSPFLVDSTPPHVQVQQTSRTGHSAIAQFSALDQASVLTRAEYAVDAKPPRPLFSGDGIVDSKQETFTVEIDDMADGEHLITLRVYDSAGNVGVGKALLPASNTGEER
ncbi:MAG: WD40 repeat domain-containing protein [Acidobacteria bacterium]|nr:WD40 repeat domain-containing protein [Acidobacteriota bacterium]